MATKTNLRIPQYSWGIPVDSFLDGVTPRKYLILSHAVSYGLFDVFAESEVKKESQVPATALSDAQKNITQKTLPHTAAVNDMQLSGVPASTTIDLLNGVRDFSDSLDFLVNTYFRAAYQACGTVAWRFCGDGNDWLQRMEWPQFADRYMAPNTKSIQNADRVLLIWRVLRQKLIDASKMRVDCF